MECGRAGQLLGLDVGRAAHLAPLLRFVGDELSKVGVGTREHRSSQVGEAFLYVGIGKSGIDLLVEHLDNLRGWLWARRSRTSLSPRSPAEIRPRSGHPAEPPGASRSSLPARAACRP